MKRTTGPKCRKSPEKADGRWEGKLQPCYAAQYMGSASKAVRPGNAAGVAKVSGAAGLLTSRDNRWLKAFRIALRGGLPTETGAVGVEGVRLTEEALRSGCRIDAVLFSESGSGIASGWRRTLRGQRLRFLFCTRPIGFLRAWPTPSIRKALPRW